MEIHIYYKERGVEDVCHKRISCYKETTVGVYQGDPHVTRRVGWKVFVIRDFHICYKDRGILWGSFI